MCVYTYIHAYMCMSSYPKIQSTITNDINKRDVCEDVVSFSLTFLLFLIQLFVRLLSNLQLVSHILPPSVNKLATV